MGNEDSRQVGQDGAAPDAGQTVAAQAGSDAASSGQGAGVPGHDDRDFVFAHKYGLPIRQVVSVDNQPYDTNQWQEW